MNTAAIYHRPESEFAYLYQPNEVHLRLQTARDDVRKVSVLALDPYQFEQIETVNEQPMHVQYQTAEHDIWQVTVTASYRRLSYLFLVEDFQGERAFYGEHGLVPVTSANQASAHYYFRLPYFHEIDRVKTPDWAKETIWYQIFPERFANGNPKLNPADTREWNSKESPSREAFYGGDLQGVFDHLNHFTELGINGLYFCPLFKASSNHKYDTIDYYEIDPAFGDLELFKEVVNACHARGIRVMLDAVFNHLGDASPQWQDVLEKGADSPYADWFHVHKFPIEFDQTADFEVAENLSFDTFAFTPHMPKLNTANPEVQTYLLDIATYWIKETGIDAWRLDVANEVDHHFWKKFQQACRELNPDFYILGEIWHSSQSWLQGDEFDAVMNYAFTDTIFSYFLDDTVPVTALADGLATQFALYREQTNQVMFNVLDSHDTARLLHRTGENLPLMQQILAFTYLQKGVPCLYYGDEFAMTGDNDPDCRKCMDWQPDETGQAMFGYLKDLIALRKKIQPILTNGQLVWKNATGGHGLLEFCYQTAEQSITAIFNTGQTNALVHFPHNQLVAHHALIEDGGAPTLAPYGWLVTTSPLTEQEVSQ